jgi:hypothetical protein
MACKSMKMERNGKTWQWKGMKMTWKWDAMAWNEKAW